MSAAASPRSCMLLCVLLYIFLLFPASLAPRGCLPPRSTVNLRHRGASSLHLTARTCVAAGLNPASIPPFSNQVSPPTRPALAALIHFRSIHRLVAQPCRSSRQPKCCTALVSVDRVDWPLVFALQHRPPPSSTPPPLDRLAAAALCAAT